MLRNYLKIAWRNLTLNKSFTFINLLGLTKGFAITLLIVQNVLVQTKLNKRKMKNNSRLLLLIIIVNGLLMSFCSNKNEALKDAKDKLLESNYISYTEKVYLPIPDTDLVDTVNTKIEFLLDDNDSLGYNYIQMSDRGDAIYKDNMLWIVDHKDSLVRIYLPTHFEKNGEFKKIVKRNIRDKWSPMILLKKEWEYVNDTTIDNSYLHEYYRIEKDYIYEKNKIQIQFHIFINSNKLFERFERRNYINGSLDQRVVINFSNYKLSQNQVALTYDLPDNYSSAYGKEKKLKGLEVGEVAPEFNGITMDGDSVSLKMFKGKKVLLNFSVINCAYCTMALERFNQEGYVLTDKISVLYINPEDDKIRMNKYMKKVPIPFPVILEAEDIGKKYKIIGYPKYFLIDENGLIEKIQYGYSKEFIDEFRM